MQSPFDRYSSFFARKSCARSASVGYRCFSLLYSVSFHSIRCEFNPMFWILCDVFAMLMFDVVISTVIGHLRNGTWSSACAHSHCLDLTLWRHTGYSHTSPCDHTAAPLTLTKNHLCWNIWELGVDCRSREWFAWFPIPGNCECIARAFEFPVAFFCSKQPETQCEYSKKLENSSWLGSLLWDSHINERMRTTQIKLWPENWEESEM